MLVLFLIVMVRNKPHQLDGKALCISLIFGLAFNGQLILNIFVTMIFVSSLFECGKVAPLKLICYWFIEVLSVNQDYTILKSRMLEENVKFVWLFWHD